MATAARSPAPTASTTEAGPVTASPPAKSQSTLVAPVLRSVLNQLRFSSTGRSPMRAFASSDWPTAAITWSHSTVKSGLRPATG